MYAHYQVKNYFLLILFWFQSFKKVNAYIATQGKFDGPNSSSLS